MYTQVSESVYRLDPIKPSLVEGPDYAYQFVLTYLNEDLSSNFDIYVFYLL